MAVRFFPVVVRQPRRGADARDSPAIALHLVEAREIDPPPSEEPIVWRLLTTHAATTLAEAAEIVGLYRRRWDRRTARGARPPQSRHDWS